MTSKTRQGSDPDIPAPLRIGGSRFVFDRRIGSHGERYRAHAIDRKEKSFLIHVLPRDKSNVDQIAVLRGMTNGDPNLPQIQEFSVQGNSIFVVLPWVPGRA